MNKTNGVGMESKVDLEKMRSEGGKVGAGAGGGEGGTGGEGEGKWLAEGQTSLCLWCGLPQGLGSCIAPLLLIGQFTLLYPLFLSFRSNGEAAVCGYIKLPGIIPGRREANKVLANKDSGRGWWVVRSVRGRVSVYGQSVPWRGRRAPNQDD